MLLSSGLAAPVRLELTTLGLTVRCSTDWAKEQYFRLFLSNNRQKDGKWRCPILPVSVPTSTFGVRKLNFCVRYGNRWNLSAIITTMVIYQTIFGQTYTNYVLKHNALLLRGHYPLTPRLIFPASPPFKNFSFQSPFPKIDNYIANNFSYKRKIFFVFI